MRLVAGSCTDVGQVRSINEDNLLVVDGLFAVADGMGGHRSGEVASEAALARFRDSVTNRTLDELMSAVQAANREVFEQSHSAPELAGMGTTLCAVCVLDELRVGIVNVGDSRVYLLRGDEFFQISEDHSFVESLVREGRLTRAQADVHPQRNVLTRALGIESHIEVDGWEVVVYATDRFVLCSDGLFNELTDDELVAVLTTEPDPVKAAATLVAAANAGGGRDNITCVVADVVETIPQAGVAVADSLTRRNSAADLDETAMGIDHPDAVATVRPSAASAQAGEVEESSGRSRGSRKPPKGRRPPRLPDGSVAPSEGGVRVGRRFTWRTFVVLLTIVAVFVVALLGVFWYGRHTFYVGADRGQVVIYQGPPEGVLWIDPILTEQPIKVSEIFDESQRVAVENTVEKPSFAAAQEFVNNLQLNRNPEVDRTNDTTTTTSTTTTPTGSTTSTTAVIGG